MFPLKTHGKFTVSRFGVRKRLVGVSLAVVLAVLAFAVLRWLPASASSEYLPREVNSSRAQLSDDVSIRVIGRADPRVSLRNGHQLLTSYQGPEQLQRALTENQAQPQSLTFADFDEDGVSDLVSSYAYNGRGIITIHRGNVDSIYPNAPEAQQRRANATFTDAPFISPALVFDVPVAADFVGAGDFDADGHSDVVVGSRGGTSLFLLSGDGKGGLSLSRELRLTGNLTAFTTGEINRSDGLTDIVVGVDGKQGPQVLIFEGPEGALKSQPEIFGVTAPVTSLALGQLDSSYEMDLAAASGNNLLLIHGRDRKLSEDPSLQAKVPPAKRSQRTFSAPIKSLALGDFAEGKQLDIALLAKDGSLVVLSGNPNEKIASWQQQELSTSQWPAATMLERIKTSSLPKDELLIIESTETPLHIVKADSTGTKRDLVNMAYENGGAVAALPMRLNPSGLSSVVLLSQGQSAPTVITAAASKTFVVNSNADIDDGNCSPANCTLREAINSANDHPGADEITFSIGTGPQIISVTSQLPVITEAVTIDGTTQPGFSGKPIIEVNGSLAGTGTIGFFINAGNTRIVGLVINRFGGSSQTSGSGIIIFADNNVIEGNFIGTDITGEIDLGNAIYGILIVGGSANIIGGDTSASRNVISGNGFNGVQIAGASATNNQVKGNFIGTNSTGTADVGNTQMGIFIQDGINSRIGGNGSLGRNIIAGNDGTGVYLRATTGTHITGNFIGTDALGTHILGTSPPTSFGPAIQGNGILSENVTDTTVGGTSAGARNIVVRTNGSAIDINGSHNLVQGNFVGTDVTGSVALGDTIGIGVSIRGDSNVVGGVVAFSGNLISGNFHNIYIFEGSGNQVQGNLVGTDVTGKVALRNRGSGVIVIASRNNRIGGDVVGARNIISGNDENGVELFDPAADGNEVKGNYIGVDVTGTMRLGNGKDGIRVTLAPNTLIGGPTPQERNVISANGRHGVFIGFDLINDPALTSGAVVQGNYVGTDAGGTVPLGNSQSGVFVDSFSLDNTVRENLIAFNGADGITIPDRKVPGVQIFIDSNLIFANRDLGIDLGAKGITPNDFLDPDNGANLQQNFPVLTSVVSSPLAESIWERAGEVGREMPDPIPAAALTINGTLNSTANATFTVHWYFSTDTQCAANQAATRPLLTGKVPDVMTNSNGDAQFSFPFDFPAGTTGGIINCTATDAQGNTSEFSSCFPVNTLARTLTVASTNPASGVSVTVSPNDNSSQGNGATQFTRSYNNNTAVSLTAPAIAGGNNFQKWLKDGADFANNTVSNVSVTMDANHTMTVVYVTPARTLTVASTNPASGVDITVGPNDNSSQGNGATQFTRSYNHNTVVSLTAPATASGNNFQKWLKDGADFANNTVSNVSVTMDANHTMTAVYFTPARTLTVASTNPASGVSITVSPNDNSSQGNGTTQFTRSYNHNTVVSLTAPATASGNNFQKWLQDGVDFANNTVSNVSVTMDANHTMTAVYVTPTPTGPGIFVEAGTNNLAALDSVTLVRGPFALTNTKNFSSDQRTRIIFFTTDLGFAQSAQPDLNTLSVQVGGNSYTVESVGPDATINGSYVVFRLPDLAAPGTYPLGIRIRGVNSANGPNLTIISSPSPAVTFKSNIAKLVDYLLFYL